MSVLLGRSCTGTWGGDRSSQGFVLVCHLCTLPAPASHKNPGVTTAASPVSFRRKDVISCSDNSPTPTGNPGFQEESQTLNVQSPRWEKPLNQMQSSRKSFSEKPGERNQGIRASQSFSHSQVSQLVDRRRQPSLGKCLGLVCAHSTQLWRSDLMEVWKAFKCARLTKI